MVLGYLDPRRFLGGRMQGQPELARKAVAAAGQPLGLDLVQTAIGIHRIINTHMAVGLRLTLEAKGCDPSRFVLVPFGGAGPLHAWRLAEEVRIPRILVPPHPGIGCAEGLLQTDVVHVYMQSYLVRIDRAPEAEVNSRFQNLTQRAWADAAVEGFQRDEVQIHRQMDIRYPHQGYELAMDVPAGTLAAADLARIRQEFDKLHERVYGVAAPDEAVELVNLRVRSVVPRRPLQPSPAPLQGESPAAALTGEREAYFEGLGAYVKTRIYDRSRLQAGNVIPGPAVIEQLDATTVIGPGWTGRIDAFGNIGMSRGV